MDTAAQRLLKTQKEHQFIRITAADSEKAIPMMLSITKEAPNYSFMRCAAMVNCYITGCGPDRGDPMSVLTTECDSAAFFLI